MCLILGLSSVSAQDNSTTDNFIEQASIDSTISINTEETNHTSDMQKASLNIDEDKSVSNTATGSWATAKNAIQNAAASTTVYLNGLDYTATSTSDTITVSKSITINGGSSTNQNLISTLNMNKLGTIIKINNGLSVTIVNVNFVNGFSNSTGGAISVGNKSNLTLDKTVFKNNFAGTDNLTHGGGAVYGPSSSIITVKNSKFINNSCIGFGSAILTRGGTVFVSGSQFQNNNATCSGVIGGRIGSKMIVSYSNFTNNQVNAAGGAIYGEINIKLNITNIIATNNKAGTRGGAVYVYGGNVIIEKSDFINNNAKINGGALCAGGYQNSEWVVRQSNFINNTATNGGAIYTEPKVNLTVVDSMFKNNKAQSKGQYGQSIRSELTPIVINSRFYDNKYAWYFDDLQNIINKPENGVVYLGNQNYTYDKNNAIMANSNRSFVGSVNITKNIIIYGGWSTNDDKTSNINGMKLTQILNIKNNINVKIINVNFVNGFSNSTGGAISVGNKSNLTLDKTVFKNNFAGTDEVYQGGGAVYGPSSSIITVKNSKFINNSCIGFGSAILTRGGTVFVSGSQFQNNNATRSGVISGRIGSKMIVSYSNFTNNQANTAGGVVYGETLIKLNITNIIATNNKAGTWGGAVYVLGGDVIIEKSDFINNNATMGGALCAGSYANYNSSWIVKQSNFINNTATSSGGAIYITRYTTLILMNSKFYGGNVNEIQIICRESILNLSNNSIIGNVIPIKVNNTNIISKTQLTGNNINTAYNTPTTLTLGFVDDNNNAIWVDGGLKVNIENKNITLTFNTTTKKYTGTYTPDFIGTKTITSNMFANTQSQVKIIVGKATSTITITNVDNYSYGGSSSIKITIPNGYTGTLNIKYGNKNYNITITSSTSYTETITGVNAGQYTITVTYSGNVNYQSSSKSTTFTVNKAVANITIDKINNYIYGGSTSAKVNVNCDLTGNLKITYGSTTKNKNNIKGPTSFTETITGINAGAQTFTVQYDGDVNYLPNTFTQTFNVYKAATSITVSVANFNYGATGTVIYNVVSGTGDGQVIIKYNNQTFTEPVKGTHKINNINAGTYTLTANYTGNANYNSSIATTTFTVYKINANINLNNIANFIYGQYTNATFSLTSGTTGNVTVSYGGKSDNVFLSGKPSYNYVIAGINAGQYTFNVKYNGDVNYNPTEASKTFTVSKANIALSISAGNFVYGDYTNAVIHINNTATNGLIINYNNMNTTLLNTQSGIINHYISGLDANTYTITVYYQGDNNYNKGQASTTIVVSKAQVNITFVQLENYTYGEYTNAVFVITPVLSDKVSVSYGGVSKNIALNGQTGIRDTITGINAGNYTYTVSYEGDKNHESATNSVKFTVFKAESEISVSINDFVYGGASVAEIQFNKALTGTVTVNYGDVSESIVVGPANAGTIRFTVHDLNAKTGYTFAVNYNGDNNFKPSSDSKTFNVNKADLKFDMNIPNYVVGGATTITVNVLNNTATGTITYSYNTKTSSFDFSKGGRYTYIIKDLDANTYTVSANYAGDNNYNAVNMTKSFQVTKAEPQLVVEVSNSFVGETLEVSVDMSNDATGTVTLKFPGKNDQTTTLNNGNAVFTVAGLVKGDYNIQVTYSGDNNYKTVTQNTMVSVSQKTLNMNVLTSDNVEYGESFTVTVEMSASITGQVKVTIANKDYNVDVIGGRGSLSLNGINPGDYLVSAVYAGNDEYANAMAYTCLSISKLEPTITVNVPSSISEGQSLTVQVTTTDSLTNGVKLLIDGSVAQNAVFTTKTVKFNVNNLAAGTHSIVVVYEGNNIYNGYTTESKTVNVTPANSSAAAIA